MNKLLVALLVAAIEAGCILAADGRRAPEFHSVWKVASNRRTLGETKENKPTVSVSINHRLLVDAITNSKEQNSPAALSFLINDKPLDCQLVPSAVVPPKLQAKFPTTLAMTGNCHDGSTATMVLNTERKESVSSTIYHSETMETFYLDHEASEEDPELYSLYQTDETEKLSDKSDDLVIHHGNERKRRSLYNQAVLNGTLQTQKLGGLRRETLRKLQETPQAYVYKIAMPVANSFSQQLNYDRTAVHEEVVKIMARLNGILLRELSVMFTLIDDNNLLYCAGESDCNGLTESDTATLAFEVEGFITNRGVSLNQYDLGHMLSASTSSGFGQIRSLCEGAFKAQAASSNKFPIGSATFVNGLIAHEVGHQLSG